MKFIRRKCENDECGKEFDAALKEINRGYGKYCSRVCSARDNGSKRRKEKIPNTTCVICDKNFYVKPSYLGSTKSGLHCCSKECKDKAARVDSGITDMHPSHYKGGYTKYRKRAFEHYPNQCARCGWQTYQEVLQVHHKDGNRQNGALDNLEILCPTCHVVTHIIEQ